MTSRENEPAKLKKNKSVIDYLAKFVELVKTGGLASATRIAAQYLSNPAVNPLTRKSLYRRWIKNNEPDPKQLEDQKKCANSLPLQPKISLLVPVYNPPLDVLVETLDSVASQTYPNWECCISNGDPSNQVIKEHLDARAESDKRFKVIHLDQNLGIAGNTNAAAALATGDYVGFLDHDDSLAPFALFEVAKTLSSDPDIEVLYSDEDVLNERGRRVEPFFKPGYSPDLMCSMNYMCHFFVLRKRLGDALGWLRTGYDGAQDFDFILRAAELAKKIHRIPGILYHWRSVKGSTASDYYAKPYATEAGIKALEDHLKRSQQEGVVSTNYMPTWYRVSYSLPEQPLVSIIIPNHNHADDLRNLTASILEKSTYTNFEILIVENNSQEKATFDLYNSFRETDQRIRIIEWNQPFNYSSVNNFAAESTSAEVLLFLNNDIEIITPDWIEQMLMHALRPETGTVGAKLLYPNDTIQHAGLVVGIGGTAGHVHKGYHRDRVGYGGLLKQVHNVSANTAACLMVRRKVFEMAGGFDPKYVLAFGDVDLCLKIMENGFVNVWTPFAELYHHESKTRGYEVTREQKARFEHEKSIFRGRWRDFLEKGDPYYNPNLSLRDEGYSIDPKTRSDRE